MHKLFLGIGSNMGDRLASLNEAFLLIEKNIGAPICSSSVYETEPWGFKAEENFLNMAVEVSTKLSPSGILGAILMIESMLGRLRGEKQYSSRIIDIDILLYNNLILDEISLKIPHPLMHERKFVLVPLCEIAGDLIHPVFKQSFNDLLKICKDSSEPKKISPPFPLKGG